MGTQTPYLERETIMQSVHDILVKSSITLREALRRIDTSSKQILLVIDDTGLLIGTLSDGDIRRGLLNGHTLEENIEPIYFSQPTVVTANDSKEMIIRLSTAKKIHQIPVVDQHGKPIGIEILDELVAKPLRSNPVVLMAGGLGTRLGELTKNTPKPMLYVGNKPILQTIIEKFAKYGYTNIILSVSYLSHLIEEYFGDGSRFGVSIHYIHETERMGTAGALSLMRDILNEPFFVMNADILTNVNFEHLHNHHTQHEAIATMCIREYEFQVPYGVVNLDEAQITSIFEKPIHTFNVSAGIYMLNPEILSIIPNHTFYDMPTLFETLIEEKKKILSFPIREYWLDIGRAEEYERANSEYHGVFH